jgi:hypothetical protein
MANTTAIRNEIKKETFKSTPRSVSQGTTIYVDSNNGSDASAGDRYNNALATLAQAITNASDGDRIIILPSHAESTRAITISKELEIIGTGVGRARPAFTFSGAAADLITVTDVNVLIENVRLVGGTNATALLNIGAADFTGDGIVFEHGAAPVSAVTVEASSDRFILDNCMWFGTAAGPDHCVVIEGKADTWKIRNAYANYGASSGLDLGFLVSSFAMVDYVMENITVIGFDAVVIDINSSTAAVGDGICSNGRFVASTALTSIEDCLDIGGCAFIECYATDAVASAGGRVPIATAS